VQLLEAKALRWHRKPQNDLPLDKLPSHGHPSPHEHPARPRA
jgi:hypothetical protein